MHQLRHLSGAYRLQHVARGDQVVALEIYIVIAADLCLQHHHRARLTEMPPPVARLGKVGILNHDIRMHATQHLKVRAMLVQHDQIRVAPGLQTCHQILADETSAARQDDFLFSHSDIEFIEDRARQMADHHHDQRPLRRRVDYRLATGNRVNDTTRHSLY